MRKLEDIKIAIAIPLQQHSYKTAEALVKKNLLFKYYTTVFYDKNKAIYKVIEKVSNKNICQRMKGKCNDIFEKYVQKYYEIIGLGFLFLIRIDSKRLILPKFQKYMNRMFGKKIAKECIKNNLDMIIMYDTQAYDCFKKLHKKNFKTIKVLDMASVSAMYIREIIVREIEKNNIFKDSMQLRLKEYEKNICKLYQDEITLADYILVACTFAKRTLIELGVSENKILYLPLGVQTPKLLQERNRKYDEKTKLKFLFVGRVEAAKGIYYLLEAFKELSDENIELEVVGEIRCEKEILDKYRKNVSFIGMKRREEMINIYCNADIYILPSLWEGFSLSLFEALSTGLPVIATKNSCAPDVIEDFKEGFIIEPENIKEIKEKILWFINNKDKIIEMSQNSFKLAERYTWEKYNENIVKVLEEIIKKDSERDL